MLSLRVCVTSVEVLEKHLNVCVIVYQETSILQQVFYFELNSVFTVRPFR